MVKMLFTLRLLLFAQIRRAKYCALHNTESNYKRNGDYYEKLCYKNQYG